MRSAIRSGAVLVVGIATLVACAEDPRLEAAAANDSASAVRDDGAQPIAVSGSSVHYFSTAIVHSRDSTRGRVVQRSSEIVKLTGDLEGYILYHPVSVFDLERGTLVNTGTQVFSGTVHGSEPVLLHDDSFRFEVDLATGATAGAVTLSSASVAAEGSGGYECRLTVTGTGRTPEGDNLASYRGECTRRGDGAGS